MILLLCRKKIRSSNMSAASHRPFASGVAASAPATSSPAWASGCCRISASPAPTLVTLASKPFWKE